MSHTFKVRADAYLSLPELTIDASSEEYAVLEAADQWYEHPGIDSEDYPITVWAVRVSQYEDNGKETAWTLEAETKPTFTAVPKG